MKHIASVTCCKSRPVSAHTAEEVAKFLEGALALLGSAVGLLSSIEELRELKEGNLVS